MEMYKTPGVYVEELSSFPPSVADVATAIPVFIGFTEKGEIERPIRITSLLEYENIFGYGAKPCVNNKFVLYDSIRLFYDNGGGICWIYPIGNYNSEQESLADAFKNAVEKIDVLDEVTLILFPDATMMLDDSNLASLQINALNKAKYLQDKFVILDVKNDNYKNFRNNLSTDSEALRYGAAYYPMLRSVYNKSFDIVDVLGYEGENDKYKLWNDKEVKSFYDKNKDNSELLVSGEDDTTENANLSYENLTTEEIKNKNDVISFFKKISNFIYTAYKNRDKNDKTEDEKKAEIQAEAYRQKIESLKLRISRYNEVVNAMNSKACIIPPSGAIAGIMSRTDRNRGVWSAPANVGINSVSDITKFVTDAEQAVLNVDADSGKSINAIRWFTGKGIMVWGARTLDGNSNEWRYISVRRLFNYVEESLKKSTSWAEFQPNDANTWVKLKSQIENFLSNLWRDGALAGATPQQAFFVKVGIPETMSSEDVLNGIVRIKIGMAAVRPAEFIILQFSHMMQK